MIDLSTLFAPVSNRVLARLQIAVRDQRVDLQSRHDIAMQRTTEIEKEAHTLAEDIADIDKLALALALEQERRDA